ncbi:stealth family protein [Rhodococcus koreensis]|uniref:Stealth protein CR1, conserved region 1 n=1 Tax=Rhodococcus koreensis TaxID=99653 RepID=A0A1H4LGR2_9NOCA|nr:Stealth protein CR1, conserved region 1 [Rhodococcus koreensis]
MSTPTRSPSRTGTADTPPGPRGGDTRPAGTHTLLGRGGELTGPPVPAVPAACRLHNRSEVVEFGGRYGLRISTTTPHEATAEDLLFVRSVLDDAGIGYLLVRGNHTRPVLAVNWADRQALRTALVAASADQPFYVKAVGTGRAPGLIADGTLSHTPAARILRLFRPRLEPVSGLRYGAEGAVQVELWSYTDDEIAAPAANALTRPVMARREAVPAVIERDGRSWPTVAGMFDLHPADVPFPIDLVFSWVDGSDTRWQVQRARRMRNYVVGDGDDSPARYRQINELKYALRSVHMYAPWIRRIFVATDSPRPAWLADHTRVIVVRSEEFFTDPSVLPTHNSHAVESQLHRIPGLAEHFLYANDDMFFGRAVAPQLFFTAGSVSRFIESGTRIGLGRNCPRRSGFENAARVNRVLLQQRFGVTITRHLEHTPVPLRRSVMAEMEEQFPREFAATAASPFRAAENISVTNSLYHYYALLTGRAVPHTAAKVRYVDTTTVAGLRALGPLLAKRNKDMFCLNDGSTPEVDLAVRTATVTEFLDRYYPIPAPWETGYPR